MSRRLIRSVAVGVATSLCRLISCRSLIGAHCGRSLLLEVELLRAGERSGLLLLLLVVSAGLHHLREHHWRLALLFEMELLRAGEDQSVVVAVAVVAHCRSLIAGASLEVGRCCLRWSC